MAQSGDPSNSGKGGESIFNLLNGPTKKKYFTPEYHPKLKHDKLGVISMVTTKVNSGDKQVTLAGSQFFFTLKEDLDYLDGNYVPFGHIAEGLEVLEKLNQTYCDDQYKPLRDIRIKHTIILEDPFPDPEGLQVPEMSPEPSKELLNTLRVGEDEELEPDLPPEQLEKLTREREAQAQALTLEMVGDLPFADVKPPENVLFVCKLNPITRDEDLELIFSRFGPVTSCEIIRDFKTGESLCYAFIEFENQEDCEEAYFKMDNVLIDDKRIHVDFSQSVSKLSKEFLGSGIKAETEDRNSKYEIKYKEGFGSSRKYDLVFEHPKEKREFKEERRRKDEYHSRDRDRRGDRRGDRSSTTDRETRYRDDSRYDSRRREDRRSPRKNSRSRY
ncbi:RNA-binding domain-containing protein [Neoconidiobolus thromboides FSU 785]|nr:RNA-binding domain-containing protein [Neoconidiobolus thromboides FSU 785]